MKEFLASIEERFPEFFTLENSLIKEFDKLIPVKILAHYPRQIIACTLIIRKKKEEALAVVALNPLKPTQSAKGKEVLELLITHR